MNRQVRKHGLAFSRRRREEVQVEFEPRAIGAQIALGPEQCRFGKGAGIEDR